jgi:nucleotide-binding universal stress UspA family protein
MSALATRPHRTSAENDSRERSKQNVPPIVAAVDGSGASRAAIGEAVRLAGELDAPITFVYVRRGPTGFFGAPIYQRRLTNEMAPRRAGARPSARGRQQRRSSGGRVRSSRARRGGGSPNSRAIGARGSLSSARPAASSARACRQP